MSGAKDLKRFFNDNVAILVKPKDRIYNILKKTFGQEDFYTEFKKYAISAKKRITSKTFYER